MSDDALAQLAPTGRLRAAINLSNNNLVTGKAANGDPEGVAPDMARALAERLGVEVDYLTFPSPGELADGVADGVWDVGFIAADPTRAETIAFTAAYVEIEATYLVRDDSPFQKVEDVDRDGVRIAISGRSAYDLYLSRTLQHAELLRADSGPASAALFVDENCDALAGLRPSVTAEQKNIPGTRVLPGKFTSAQQAAGTHKGNDAALTYLREVIEESKSNGLVAQLIEKHGVTGRLTVAPPA